MADLKISQLTSATTPLAGTEEVPLVQSSSTKKVTVSDLTVGRAVSGASFNVTSSSVPANGFYLPAANSVGIATNSTQRVQVNAAGQIGVGVVPYASVGANGDLLQIGNPLTKAGSGLTIGATTTGDIQYSNAASGTGQYAGLLRYVFSTNTFSIWTNSASRVTVGSGGDTTLVTGNLVIGTAGKGIDFSANANAPGMTSELLNWYEEGTWTPTLQGGTTAGSYTVSTTTARYTRIGRQVTVTAGMTITVNSAGTGSARFGGLPFTKGASQFLSGSVYTSSVTYGAGVISVNVQAWTSSASTDFALVGVRSATTPYDVLITDFVNGSIVYITMTYFV